MSQHKRGDSNRLEPPRKSTELEDPGAHELSSEGEEYFSDASEGQGRKRSSRPVTPSSPIPITRIEKVDDEPSYGEVPGTDAYDKRKEDAVPDEVDIIHPGRLSRPESHQNMNASATPGGTPIPRTVVEKLDLDEDGYGDVPGTEAYQKRLADATPDVVLKNPDPTKGSRYKVDQAHRNDASTTSVPETIVSSADEDLTSDAGPGKRTFEPRDVDALRENKQTGKDDTESDISFDTPVSMRRRSTLKGVANGSSDALTADDPGLGDDFDDFEEGAQVTAEDDFGDFDDFEPGRTFEDETPRVEKPQSHFDLPAQAFPLIDFDALSALPDLIEATKLHLDAMFPNTANADLSNTSVHLGATDSVFPTERSASLWKQLITPPPLQPPNWTQSRIRRLFLISLGVPVDLDEVLPPAKQKKLVLPDIDLPSSRASMAAEPDTIKQLKQTGANDSSASLSSQTSATNSRSRSRPARNTVKAVPAPPPLDMNAVKQLCSTTSEKLDGMDDEELESHVQELEAQTERTSKLLEYWLGRRDELRKEKEAFEGVVENLVKHAKRIRTLK